MVERNENPVVPVNETVGPATIQGFGQPSLFDRTIANIRRAWLGFANANDPAALAAANPDLPAEDQARLAALMRDCLAGRGGEVSARTRAVALGEAYLALNPTGRERFLEVLARDFDIDGRALNDAMKRALAAKDGEDRRSAERALRRALEAPRVKLLSQFTALPDGIKFLVHMRAELRGLLRQRPDFAGLEADLQTLLGNWFNVGLLELRRMTWQETPAAILEKVIAYEAVHAVRDWDDLKNRLSRDRRCYGYFHPRMPDEPLIFVQVALTRSLPDKIAPLLDTQAPEQDPDQADTAVFYSISNTQAGLVGIGFGAFLIKRVVDDLTRDLPRVRTFCTLSPIPGFRAWLDGAVKREGGAILSEAERVVLAPFAADGDPARALLDVIGRRDWHRDVEIREVVRRPLMRLAVRYLTDERHSPGNGRALDPVAHFHLSNGARMERLNWLADVSPRGLEQSAGMMINYVYRLAEIESNHEAYSTAGGPRTSSALRALGRA
jgi:malonyl-CoA decarboxylase